MTERTGNTAQKTESRTTSEELKTLTVQVPTHMVRDLETMEKNSKKSVDTLVSTAISFFIATHNDYLGTRR